MNNSDSSSDPASPRVVLTLKVGAQKSARKSEAPPSPHPRNKSDLKPGARWSDEYTQRMQRDMDAMHSDYRRLQSNLVR
jgi:hypothetical protein